MKLEEEEPIASVSVPADEAGPSAEEVIKPELDEKLELSPEEEEEEKRDEEKPEEVEKEQKQLVRPSGMMMIFNYFLTLFVLTVVLTMIYTL